MSAKRTIVSEWTCDRCGNRAVRTDLFDFESQPLCVRLISLPLKVLEPAAPGWQVLPVRDDEVADVCGECLTLEDEVDLLREGLDAKAYMDQEYEGPE